MGLFKRKNNDEQPRTCPECCQIVAANATQCDRCRADLTATPAQETTTPSPVAAGIERYR
jgi:hypothetical protein